MTSYVEEKWLKGEYSILCGAVGISLKGEGFRPFNKESVKELLEKGYINEITAEATNKAYKEYLADFFADYTKNQANRTQEEINEQRSEARAAMGSGVKMMNIITGETYTT